MQQYLFSSPRSGDVGRFDEFEDKVFLRVALQILRVLGQDLLLLLFALNELACRHLLLQVGLSEINVVKEVRVIFERLLRGQQLPLGRIEIGRQN